MRELTGQLEVEGKGHHAQVATLKCQLNELKDKLKCMAGQLTSLEKANSHLDVDLRTAQRHMEATNEDNIRLKEEVGHVFPSVRPCDLRRPVYLGVWCQLLFQGCITYVCFTLHVIKK